MKKLNKEYIGDSVYAYDDEYGIVLTTENGMGASNTIYLEEAFIPKLEEYIGRWKEVRKL